MKIPFKRKEESPEVEPSASQYPWGLRITLDDEMLAKFPAGLLSEIGKELTIPMTIRVVSLSEDDVEGTLKKYASLQIISAEIPEAKKVRNLYETGSENSDA